MFRFLPLVLKNCWRNRRRTFLTIASISVSMCLLGVMIAMYHALYLSDATPEQALRLVTRNKISLTQQMPESYKNRIRQIPGVREVMVSQWFGGTYKDPKNFFARFAADSDKIFTVFQELKIPADQRIAFERDRTGCVIGRDLANKYNLKIGDRIRWWATSSRATTSSPSAASSIARGPARSCISAAITWSSRCRSAGAATPGVFTIADRRPGVGRPHRIGHRRGVPQCQRADEDGERAAVPARFRLVAGQREDVPDCDLRRRDVHHPAGFGQYDGDVGARAGARSRRAEDAGLHRRQRAGHDSGRGDVRFRCWAERSASCFPRCWWAAWRTVRPGAFCRRFRRSSPRWPWRAC